MQVDPRQYFAIVPNAFQRALFLTTDRLCGAQKSYCNGLTFFGRVAIADRTVLLVYRQNNLDHNSPRKPKLAQRKYNVLGESQQGRNVGNPVEDERRFRWEGEQFLSSTGMAFGLERNVFL
jgi:hypothetical protein